MIISLHCGSVNTILSAFLNVKCYLRLPLTFTNTQFSGFFHVNAKFKISKLNFFYTKLRVNWTWVLKYFLTYISALNLSTLESRWMQMCCLIRNLATSSGVYHSGTPSLTRNCSPMKVKMLCCEVRSLAWACRNISATQLPQEKGEVDGKSANWDFLDLLGTLSQDLLLTSGRQEIPYSNLQVKMSQAPLLTQISLKWWWEGTGEN